MKLNEDKFLKINQPIPIFNNPRVTKLISFKKVKNRRNFPESSRLHEPIARIAIVQPIKPSLIDEVNFLSKLVRPFNFEKKKTRLKMQQWPLLHHNASAPCDHRLLFYRQKISIICLRPLLISTSSKIET